jgi:hypothetical protein
MTFKTLRFVPALALCLGGCAEMASDEEIADEAEAIALADVDAEMMAEGVSPCDHDEADAALMMPPSDAREIAEGDRFDSSSTCLSGEHLHFVDFGTTRLGTCANGQLIFAGEQLCMRNSGGYGCGGEWYVYVRRPWWPPESFQSIKIRALTGH